MDSKIKGVSTADHDSIQNICADCRCSIDSDYGHVYSKYMVGWLVGLFCFSKMLKGKKDITTSNSLFDLKAKL